MEYAYYQLIERMDLFIEAINKPDWVSIIISSVITIIGIFLAFLLGYFLPEIGKLKIVQHYYTFRFFYTDMIPSEVLPTNNKGYHFVSIELPFSVFNPSQFQKYMIKPIPIIKVNGKKIEPTGLTIEGLPNTEFNLLQFDPLSVKKITITGEYSHSVFSNYQKYPKVYLRYYNNSHKLRNKYFGTVKYYTFNGKEYDIFSHLENKNKF